MSPMFAELLGTRRGYAIAAAAARCTSPTRARHARRQRHRRRRTADRRRRGCGARSCARRRGHASPSSATGPSPPARSTKPVNLAAVWTSADRSSSARTTATPSSPPATTSTRCHVEQRAAGYGVGYVAVDGNDVVAVADVMAEAAGAELRVGGGPFLVEATTYRWHGHYEGDPQRYRDDDEARQHAEPTIHSSSVLAGCPPQASTASGFRAERMRSRRGSTTRVCDATGAPAPDLSTVALDYVTAPAAGDRGAAARRRPMPADFRTMDAIHDALEHELRDDDRVFLAGIDVGDGGNVFGFTRGLRDRVRPTACATHRSRRPRSSAWRRRGDGRHATRSSRSCTSTSSACAWTS